MGMINAAVALLAKAIFFVAGLGIGVFGRSYDAIEAAVRRIRGGGAAS